MTYTLRPATAGDSAAIERLMKVSMAALGAQFYDARQTASAVEHIARLDRQLIDDGTYFVVESDGELAACGGWSARGKLFTGGGAAPDETRAIDPRLEPARIRAMYVHPAHSRRGLGRMLLDACERAARAAGFSRAELMATLPGVPLYAACGYEVLERVTLTMPDGVELGGARMGKRL